VALGAAATLGVLLTAAAGPPAQKKLPVPNSEATKKAVALVKELYGKDVDQAYKDRDLLVKLAQTLLYEAKETNDDAAGKYVLLGEAALLAMMAGDSTLALHALDEMAATFDIPSADVFKLKLQSLIGCSNATAPPDAYQATIDAARSMQDDAAANDDFDNAVAIGDAAETAAKKLKSVPLVSAIRKRNDEVKVQQLEYALVKPFVDTLKKDAKDAKANYEVGNYYAIVRGQWDKGLPLLAKGSHEVLAAIARLDLANKGGWADCKLIGEKWTKEAPHFLGYKSTVHVLLRAYHWYQQAFADPTITEAGRKEIEKAMLAVNEQLPPELRAGEIAVELKRFTGHNGPVFGVAISGDGSKVVSGGADGVVRLWETKSGKQLQRIDGHSGPVWAVAISLDGRQIISGGFDKTVRASSKDQYSHDDYVRAVALSANGKVILSGGDDRMIKWSGPGFSALQQASGHDHFVFGVAISRDGKRALSASLDRTVRLWDLDKHQTLKVLTGHTDTVLAVTFMPDQQRALSAGTDKTLRLWDLNTGQTLKVFKGHTGYVLSVAVSPDGRRALSAGQDGKVIVWDVETGKMLRVLTGHNGPVWSVAFSGDGRWAVTGGDDGTVRLWGNAK